VGDDGQAWVISTEVRAPAARDPVDMTTYLVTEIDDIDGSEKLRFATTDEHLADEAQSLLEHHGLRAEVEAVAVDEASLDTLDAEL
jgi:hypothetical protein